MSAAIGRPQSWFALIAAALGACVNPASDRAAADFRVGRDEIAGTRFTVREGLASIRELRDGELILWAQAPGLAIDVERSAGATEDWTITVLNAMPDAELRAEPPLEEDAQALGGPRPTVRAWQVRLSAERTTLTIATPDAADPSPWRFAYMADIQTGVDRVTDIYAVMNRDLELRFVVAGGDLVEGGDRSELVRVQETFEQLNVPFFSTTGNHELFASDADWEDLVGVRNFHFAYRGVHFSLADSGSATIDSSVYDRLDDWLEAGRDAVHLFISHYPPFDPIGIRQGGFRSRREAAALFARLAHGGVDAAFFGHIHTLHVFDVADIPVYISGGGGALPQERWDGIGRHYLTVDVSPAAGRIDRIAVTRIAD